MSFFAVLLSVFVAGDLLWASRAARRLPRRWQRVTAVSWVVLMVAGLAMVIVGRFAGTIMADSIPRLVLSLIFIWHLLIIPLWLLWQPLRSLIGVLRRRAAVDRPATNEGLSRREFVTAAATFAPAILTAGSALAAELQVEQFRIRRLLLPVPHLPPALNGFTIAQVSDVHVGRFTHGSVLERIVRAANDLQPDLTVMTGDLINFAMRDLPAGIDLARGLKARHGVYLCEGNHDLFEDPAGFRRQVLRSGLALLREDDATIDVNGAKLQLVGVPWTHGDAEHTVAARGAAALKRADAFSILLAHHPHVFDFAADFPVVLSGHTHGGQLMLSEDVGFGPWMFRYWSGLYRRGDRSVVVSNGVGNWFPVRVCAPAEIVHLTLRAG